MAATLTPFGPKNYGASDPPATILGLWGVATTLRTAHKLCHNAGIPRSFTFAFRALDVPALKGRASGTPCIAVAGERAAPKRGRSV